MGIPYYWVGRFFYIINKRQARRRPPVYRWKSLSGNFFHNNFVTNLSLFLWNLRKILLILIELTLWNKIFDPYTASARPPKKSCPLRLMSLDLINFVCSFPHFYKGYNGSLLAFCYKCKKNKPTLMDCRKFFIRE
jgi:hypothetical protein